MFKKLEKIKDFFTKIINNSIILNEWQQALKHKWDALPANNLELGKYHLTKGRISDAILRFKITKRFFAKDNQELDYWLGVCYFLQNDYKTSLDYFDIAQEYDKAGYADFIRNYSNYREVPWGIWQQIQIVAASKAEDNYQLPNMYKEIVDLPKEAMNFILANIAELKEEAEILDYGCGNGRIGLMLDHLLGTEYHLTGMENIDDLGAQARELTGGRGKIYDRVIKASLQEIENNLAGSNYNLIISFNSLCFTMNLTKYFAHLYKSLHIGGYFAILLPSKALTSWNNNKANFDYCEKDIEQAVKEANFNIMAQKSWQLQNKLAYSLFVCSK